MMGGVVELPNGSPLAQGRGLKLKGLSHLALRRRRPSRRGVD